MASQKIPKAHKTILHESLLQLLKEKDIKTEEEIAEYLFPTLQSLPDPSLLQGMENATTLVTSALTNKEDIIIWGDYDVDGITGTCLLIKFFELIGRKVRFHLPNRFKDGYGLNIHSLDNLLEAGKGLLITVDCGISNKREIARARSLGYKVIVTDHHEPGDNKVDADAIVNPKVPECTFPDKNIAGVGVAFYLAAGVRKKLKEKGYFKGSTQLPNLKQLLGYVAIGTIADLVPLKGANRIMVRSGFEVLQKTDEPGLRELLKSCDIRRDQPITSDDIGFQLAPKLNAAGRMGEGRLAARLLLSDSPQEASTLASKLTKLNQDRKKVCHQNLETALTSSSISFTEEEKCFIERGDYHQGVMGIVASQLVEKLHFPVIIFSENSSDNHDLMKGSARSIQGVNLYECLRECADLLETYGGHKMAAGLSLKKDKYKLFKSIFSKIVQEKIEKMQRRKQVQKTISLPIETVLSDGFIRQYMLLEPFGEANERPVFEETDPLICSTKNIGRENNHLKVTFRGKFKNYQGVGFGLGSKVMRLKTDENNRVHYSPMLNRFKSLCQWQVKIIDIQ